LLKLGIVLVEGFVPLKKFLRQFYHILWCRRLLNYPLITHKHADYQLFREIILIMLRKGHLTREGLEKIVAIKASLNLGLSDQLTIAFPNIVAIKRLLIENQIIPHPQ
jgi:hypothetical protein